MSALIALLANAALQATQPTTAPSSPPTVPEPTKGRIAGQQTYLDLEAGVGYSTNPQFSLSSNAGSGQGYISLHGVHAVVTERTTTVLSAFGQLTGYTSHYGSNESASVSARHDAAVNERLRLFVDANAEYDKNGFLDTRIIGVPDVPVPPGAPNIPPPLLSPSSDFLAVTGKHFSFGADGGGQLALGPRDNLDFSTGVQRSILHDGFVSNAILGNTSYWSVPSSIGYNRQLSARADVGGRVGFVYTDYDGPFKVWTVTPQVTTTLQLSERVNFVGALGVTFSSVDEGLVTRKSTGLAGSAALCNSEERSHLCARAAVSQQTATVGGPAKVITAGVDYSRQLDATSSILLSIDGSHYSQPISVITGQNLSDSTYYRAAATYSREFGHRLYGGVNVAARKLNESGPDPKADLNASLFIRYRFGDVQ